MEAQARKWRKGRRREGKKEVRMRDGQKPYNLHTDSSELFRHRFKSPLVFFPNKGLGPLKVLIVYQRG